MTPPITNVHTWAEWFASRGDLRHAWFSHIAYSTPLFHAIHRHVPPPATILEVGCGIGDSAIALSVLGYRVEAIDSDIEVVRAASRHPIWTPYIHFHQGDAFNLPRPPEKFDAATCLGVLEHEHPLERQLILRQLVDSAEVAIITIPSPLMAATIRATETSPPLHDITFRGLMEECEWAGWDIIEAFGWGMPNQRHYLEFLIPRGIMDALRNRGINCTSFCVIGTKSESKSRPVNLGDMGVGHDISLRMPL